MTKKFVYKAPTRETMEGRSQGGGDWDTWLKRGVPQFKPKAGKHKIRILPQTWDGASYYGYDVWVNYQIGPDKGAYLSLHKMKGTKDPIYEEYAKAKAEGRDEDAKNLAARKRILVWVIDRKAEDQGPQLWSMPVTVDKPLAMLASDTETLGIIDIAHPDEGYDVTFTRVGDGQFTKYEAISIARNPSPISDDEDTANAWLDYIMENPVPDQLNFYDYDHIKRAFSGVVEDVPAAPVRAPTRTTSNTKVTEVDEEDELAAINGEPKKSTRAAVAEVDDEDEAEEAPPPARSSLASRLAARNRK